MMQELKRGRNKVVESDHVVILGFTDKTLALICELCLAMESEGGGVIVIMDERNPGDIQEMVDEELDPHADLRGTKLVSFARGRVEGWRSVRSETGKPPSLV